MGITVHIVKSMSRDDRDAVKMLTCAVEALTYQVKNLQVVLGVDEIHLECEDE